ncbi:hypothetical protein AB0E96_21850 [Kitasatospora sp. NPDC036755]|uniref:hypothetical protein n=1 Tax=Kitasatospora sp. NPDC036755 TaxID=3154600 RepID=UPI0033E46CAC
MACSVSGPVHVRDLVRLAEHDHARRIAETSAKVAVAGDRRFCWAGAGVYGLYRHGPMPGPRCLDDAGRLVLAAADRPLTAAALDYCLKGFGYRYNKASLRNALRQSARIESRSDGQWWTPRGPTAERLLLDEVQVVPPRREADWARLRDRLSTRIAAALVSRDERLRLAESRPCGLDWGGQQLALLP